MTSFIFQFAKGELVNIERDITQVNRLRLELAAFFCEDAHTFKLEECFKVFATFCQRFGRAIDVRFWHNFPFLDSLISYMF